ncbi:Hybrid signal transduction histidine kinase K [Rhodotorula toruloides]|nr:Hybrid signal transduction histidine kinase K [Rhodotorula toruloides]
MRCLVQYALSHGQPVNSILSGVLPLHAAASSGNETVVRMLIEAGADVNSPRLSRRFTREGSKERGVSVGTQGSTPLHFAAANGHLAILHLLLSYGADPRIPEKAGITPEQIAVSNGHLDAAEVLRGWADVLDAQQSAQQAGGGAGKKGGSARSLSLRDPAAGGAGAPPSTRTRSLSTAASVLHPQRSFDRLATKLVQSAHTAQLPFTHVRGLTSSSSSLSSAAAYATPSASTSQISLGAVGGPLGMQIQGGNGSSWSVASSTAGGGAGGSSSSAPSTRRLSFTSLRSGNGAANGGAAKDPTAGATPRTRRPSLPSVWEKAGRPGAAIRQAFGLSSASSSGAPASPAPAAAAEEDSHPSADELSEQDRTERAERRRSLEVHRPLRQDSFVGTLAVQAESPRLRVEYDDEGDEARTPLATRAPELPLPPQQPASTTGGSTIGPLTRAASHHFYRPRQSSNLSKGSFSGRRPSMDEEEGGSGGAEQEKEGEVSAGVFEDEPSPPTTAVSSPVTSPNRRRALSNPNPQSGSRSPLLQQVHFNQHQQLQLRAKEDGTVGLSASRPSTEDAEDGDGDEEDEVGMLRPMQAYPTYDARRAFAPPSSAGDDTARTHDATGRNRSNSASTRFSSSPGSTYSGPTFSTYAPSASTAPTSVAPSSPGTKAKARVERAHEATATPGMTSQRSLGPLYESRAVQSSLTTSVAPPRTGEGSDEEDKPKTRAQARSRVQKAERELLGFNSPPSSSATDAKSAGSGKSLKDQLAAYGRSLKAERELVEREEREKAKARSAGYTIETISTSAKTPTPASAQQQPVAAASPAIPAWRAIPHVDRLVPPSPGRRSVSPGATSSTPRRRPSRDLDSSNPSSAKTTPPKSSITESKRASSPTSTRSGSNKSSSTTMAGGAAVLGSGPGGVSFVEVQPARADGHHHYHHHHHAHAQPRTSRSDKSHSDGRGGGATSTLSAASMGATAAGKISIRDQVEVDRRNKDEQEQRIPKAARTAPQKKAGLKRFFGGGGGSSAAGRSPSLKGVAVRRLALDAAHTMLHTAQTSALGVDAFGLPVLALSAESLSLTEANDTARRLLELDDVHDGFTAVDLFRGLVQQQQQRDEDQRVREGLKEYLIGLARRSSALAWGETVQLDFFTRTGQRRRADALVTFSSTDSTPSASTDDAVTLSILFVRPLPVDSTPFSPSLHNLNLPTDFRSAMPSSQPSTRPSSEAFTPPPNHAFSLPPHADPSTVSPSDQSASFSSSNLRPARRIAVGEERAKLPLDDNLKSMLQHATSRVTDTASTPRTASVSPGPGSPSTPPTSAAPSLSSPPVPSTNVVAASPVIPTDSPDPSSKSAPRPTPRRTPSGSKLPASVEGLTGRRQSFDQALVTLSQKTDGTARADGTGPIFFRLPVNEIDAGSSDISPRSEKDNPLAGLVSSSRGNSSDDFSQATPAEDAALLETAREEAAEKRARDIRPPLSLAQLTNMVENNPHMCFIADPDGQVVWLNSTWYEYTGGDPRYHMDFAEWMSMFHPDDLSAVLPIYLGAMQSGEPFSFEYRIKNKDGRLRWHKVSGRPQKGADGKPVAWYATIADVEPEMRARHDALLVKERTRAVLEGSDLTLLTVDPSFKITFFEGKTPPRLTGRSYDNIVGSPLLDFFPAGELEAAVQQVLDGESENGFAESETSTSQGTMYHRYRLVPLRGDPSIPQTHPDYNAITGCIIVCADVTERKLADQALQKSRDESAKLAASEVAAREASQLKTSFLTTISHEIRTPIAAILGICELLLADSNRLAPDQRNLVENAVQSGELLLELVGAVLDVRKIETGELELETAPFLLSEALADARLFSIIAQKKGLEFVEDVSEFYGGTLLADRLRLRQVLANALSNAVKFTKEGSVTLRCRQLSEDDTRIVVRFEIVDTGVGIDSTVLPTLFHPFRQADASTAREYGGSGLGLTIAKKLVELMGGNIALDSTLGQGSRMTITIPLQKAPLADVVDFVGTTQPLPAETPAEAKRLAKSEEVVKKVRKSRRPEDVRILLAEDNELIREIVTRTLRKKRFVVDAVADGRQCVEQVQRERYDCVLMDGQMPGLDGYRASQLIRQSPDPAIHRLRIIALTASAIAGDRERCLSAGMNAYLAKPVRAAELEAAIWEQVELAEDQHDEQNSVDC